MTLFEIERDLLAAYETLTDSEGEIDGEGVAAMDRLCNIQQQKLGQYYYLIKQADMEQKAAAEEAARWRKKAASREKFIEWMKSRLLDYMLNTGQPKIAGEFGTIAIQANASRPLVIDEAVTVDSLPEQYVRVVKEIRKDVITADLKMGIEVPGCKIGEPGRHLRLK